MALARGKCGVADNHSACNTPLKQYSPETMQSTPQTVKSVREMGLANMKGVHPRYMVTVPRCRKGVSDGWCWRNQALS